MERSKDSSLAEENSSDGEDLIQTLHQKTLFVNTIDPIVDHGILAKYFSQYGKIKRIKFVSEATQTHKMAYITYFNDQDAKSALKCMQYQKIGHSIIIIIPAEKRISLEQKNKLFIKNISDGVTHQELHDQFSKLSSEFYVNINTNKVGDHLSFGFIQFFEEKIQFIRSLLEGKIKIKLKHQILQFEPWKKKDKRIEKDQQQLNTAIYLKNLKIDISQEEVLSKFKDFGKIVSSDMHPSRYKWKNEVVSYAVINFESEEEAEKAVAQGPKKKNIQNLFISIQGLGISYYRSRSIDVKPNEVRKFKDFAQNISKESISKLNISDASSTLFQVTPTIFSFGNNSRTQQKYTLNKRSSYNPEERKNSPDFKYQNNMPSSHVVHSILNESSFNGEPNLQEKKICGKLGNKAWENARKKHQNFNPYGQRKI